MGRTPSVIALDGPVAVGKTSLGRLLAQRLSYRFYDTGVMYRALTWAALQQGVSPRDDEGLVRLAQQTCIRLLPSTSPDDPGGVLVDGRDVSAELRQPQVEAAVSEVSEVLGVRQRMVAKQKDLAEGGGIIMAGRDIGTVVLPDADLKVFLTASPEERARRRQAELEAQGTDIQHHTVLAGVVRRDGIDSQRQHSPLKAAPGARVIDTNGMTLEQVLARVLALAEETPCR